MPLLLALTVGAYLLARRWVGRTAAAVIAAVTSLTPAVLGWSQMLNFSVAATAASVWALAAYLHSDGFRRWPWSIATGVAVALLSLSRTVSPVYVAPLVVVMAAQSAIGRRRRRLGSSLPQIGAAAGVALVIAGPWWARSGTTGLHYLRSAGYDKSSGFNSGSHGVMRGITDRARLTLADLGVAPRITLLVLVVVAVAVLATRRHLGADAIAVVAWSLGCFAILATSSNIGTGFGLPLVAVLVVAVGTALTRLPNPAVAIASLVAGLMTVAGIVGEVTGGEGRELRGPIYGGMVVASGAAAGTNVDDVHERVARIVGSGAVVVARDDDVLNGPGLRWTAPGQLHVLLPAYGPGGTASAISELSEARFLITGRSKGPFHHGLNQRAVEASARRDGFVLLTTWTLGRRNYVNLWRR